MNKYIFSTLVILLFSVGTFAFPMSVKATEDDTIQTLQEQVSSLLEQIQSLQTQLAELTKQQGELRSELSEVRKELRLQLREGLSNDEVTILQELLAEDFEIYPEGLITGYFGPLTKKAVQKFQKKYGIEQVGEVGPITRLKLNEFIRGKSGKTPPGLFKKFGSDDDGDDDGDDDDGNDLDKDENDVDEGPGVGKVRICHKNNKTIHVGIPATMAHLNHGDTIGNCDGDNNGPGNGDNDDDDDNVDTTAPIISNLTSTNLASTSASVTWDTNEDSDSIVYYDVISGFAISSTTPVEDESNLVSNHSINLSGLSASSTYYYIAVSTDDSGNTATSSELSFVTLGEEVVDTTAPIISNLTSTNLASTSASVTWDTNEDSDSTVYFDTVSGFLVASTTSVVSDLATITSHDLSLTSLIASSTYYYIAVSTDDSGNTATSSESLFITLPE